LSVATGGGCGRLLSLQRVDPLGDHEHGGSDDQEVKRGLRELAVAKHNCGTLVGGLLEGNAEVRKVDPAENDPKGGINTSATSDPTIFPNAAPMMMPTAMSTMLP
jgi:hypothetical protein